MGWTGKILNGVGGFTKIAANGSGDLQIALQRSETSHINLVGDLAEDGQGNIYDAEKINVSAKYKPFRNSTIAFASWSARNNARSSALFGMTKPDPYVPSYQYNPVPPAWPYAKPVLNTHPLRVQDFVKDESTASAGYDPYAIPPIALSVEGQLLTDGETILMVWKDSGTNSYWASRTAPGEWWADRSLAASDLIKGNDANLHIGFALIDVTVGATAGNTPCILNTGMTLSQLSDTAIFIISADGKVIGSKTYPAIPWLNGTGGNPNRAGHTIRVAVVLVSPDLTDPNNAYEILPNNSTVYSLGFNYKIRCDYTDVEADTSSPINLLTGVLDSGPVLVDTGIVTEAGYKKYTVSLPIKGTVTKDPAFQPSTIYVHVIANVPSGGFYGDPTQPGFTNMLENTLQVSVPSSGTTYITLPDVYIYQGAPQEVIVNANFCDNYAGTGRTQPFSNTLTIT